MTPFGREFKLDGYILRAKDSAPVSAMAIASLTHTRKGQIPPPDNLNSNDNLAFDQGSVFLAGGAGQHFGGFVQITYDGVGNAWSWDNMDLRAVTKGKLFGQDAVFGLTLNNSPMVEDVWNTTPAWGFPYTDTAVSGTPGAAPLIDGGLAQNVLGLGAYAWIGHKIYVEGGAYSTPSAGTLNWLGADLASPGDINGLAPYGRVAWQQDAAGGTLELGAFGLGASVHPGRDRMSAYTDSYTDLGLDASWQKALENGDVLAVQGRYVHERSNLRASCALGLPDVESGPGCADVGLNEWRGDIGYHWRNKIGATVGVFSLSGDGNPYLYGPTGSPDSNGAILQFDYSPWGDGSGPLGPRVNLQFGLQTTLYGKFDGARSNYDGAGTNASANDEVRLYTWLAF
ncbi:MAG: hypothetical protein ABGW87_05060 [Sphingomonadaceae bacterium]